MKRAYVSKSLSEKQEILRYVQRNPGLKQKAVCDRFSINQSTLATLIKNKDQIMTAVKQDNSKNKKRLRLCKYDSVDDALLIWFKEKRASNILVDGDMLLAKANDFAKKLVASDCDPLSSSWISRWKFRHGIKSKKVTGESGSVDMNMVNEWSTGGLQEILNKFDECDIYNVDETSFFWGALPDHTMAFRDEDVRGGKKAKERVTLLVGASMTGEKLPLFMIGRYARPRCFKDVKQLPIRMYRSNKKAWMTSTLFEEWITKWDKSLDHKVALILDNCAAHPKLTSLKNVELFFLPPNTTSKTQPMDQGVIQNLKLFYRQQLALRRLMAHEKSIDFHIDLYHAMAMLRDAWKKVKPDSIIHCFNKAGFAKGASTLSSGDNEDKADFQNLFETLRPILNVCEKITVEDFVSFDDDMETSGPIDDNDIIKQVQVTPLNYDSHQTCDSDDDQMEPPKIAASDAIRAAEILNSYFDQSGIPDFTSALHKMTVHIEKDKFRVFRQKTIGDFFHVLPQ